MTAIDFAFVLDEEVYAYKDEEILELEQYGFDKYYSENVKKRDKTITLNEFRFLCKRKGRELVIRNFGLAEDYSFLFEDEEELLKKYRDGKIR